ncbi:hypothetical protein [Nocardia brevicatena]|uniref:hypothetical protein n=1 Tax=Nocardia brevicatena TaxID=37327 RepID=UPI0002FEF79F|nr:hypothetical protein [Nocardia brevicatena]
MPPDEDEDEPHTGPDKPTDMKWDDKGYLTEDGHGNSIKYGHDEHGLYPDGPGEGDNTYLRHEIRSNNGDYALRFEDGDLVIKYVGSDGRERTLWNSKTGDESWGGDVSGLKVGPNGELIITHRDANLPSAVPSSTYKLTEGIKGIEGATLILNDDGSLVIVDKDGDVRAQISPPDDKKNRPLHLYRPENISNGLREFIGVCESIILDGYYLLGAGTPKSMPNFSSLLSNKGLKDVDNISHQSEYYNDNVGAVARLKEDMIATSAKVSAAAKDMSSEGLATRSFVKAEVKALNEKLHAVDDYDSIHPKEDEKKKKKEEYDFPLEWDKEAGELRIQPAKEDRIFKWLDDTTDKITDKIQKTSNWAEKTGKDVPEDPTPKPKKTPDTTNKTPTDQGPTNQFPVDQTNPPGTDPTLQPNNPQPTNTDFGNPTGTSGSKDPSGSSTKGADAIEQLLAPIREALTNKSAAGSPGAGPATGATGSPGAGGDLMSSMMLPMMLLPIITQMMDKRKQETERDKEEREREEEERDEETGPGAPGPGATAPAPSPAPGPAPAAEPGVTAPSPESTPPPLTQKSMVDMKLPNGTSQRVSSVVAEAVNRELNNPNGSDARAAYQGTAGESSSASPWVAVENSSVAPGESSPVKTGDIALWDNRSALVIMTDSGMQTIINGQMVPLDPNNPPDGGQGGYGNFRGFFHPTGADITDVNQMATVGAPPPVSTAQPSAPATPPAVTPPPSVELR